MVGIKTKYFFGMVIVIVGIIFSSISPIHAQANDFLIMPKAEKDPTSYVKRVSDSGGHVRDAINQYAYEMGGVNKEKGGLGEQLASGIMNWDTLIDYLVYALRFLSQIALVIGAIMFVWNGYEYAMYAFSKAEPDKSKISKAITGIIIIIFSYAIMQILKHAFLT